MHTIFQFATTAETFVELFGVFKINPIIKLKINIKLSKTD